MADRTGHSVEQLDIMRQVANRAGLTLEDMVDVTEEMRIKANDTASGIETYAEFFRGTWHQCRRVSQTFAR